MRYSSHHITKYLTNPAHKHFESLSEAEWNLLWLTLPGIEEHGLVESTLLDSIKHIDSISANVLVGDPQQAASFLGHLYRHGAPMTHTWDDTTLVRINQRSKDAVRHINSPQTVAPTGRRENVVFFDFRSKLSA